MDDFDPVSKPHTDREILAHATRQLDAQRGGDSNVGDDYLRARIDTLLVESPESPDVTAKRVRGEYVDAILEMESGPARRAEIRQMLVDLLDVVEQSADEAPLIAALKAYDEAVSAPVTAPRMP